MLKAWTMRKISALIGITALILLAYMLSPLGKQPLVRSDRPAPPSPGSPSGRLAYIAADGNIYVTTPELGEPIALTNDATAPPEGPGLSYPRVSWSPTGKLAYASVIRSGNDAQARLYVQQDLTETPMLVGVSEEHFVIYIHWAPTPCQNQSDCSRLAYLIEEPDGIGLRLVEMMPGGTSNQLLGLGWPFYFSWSPDGDEMIWHTGGASRFNKDARIARFSLKDGEASQLDLEPGLFIAPAWSPGGDHWLVVEAEAGRDVLRLLPRTDGVMPPRSIQEAQDKHIVFSWSPDGSQVAYSVLLRSGGLIFGPIHVYDLESGESRQVTPRSLDISGFFWSPDGSRIAYLSRLPLREAVWLQWRVVNVEDGTDRGFAAFNPTYQMRYVVSSFNQYAQSHRLWSPDSRYLVYADQDTARVERIWLVDTLGGQDVEPIFVAEGTMGFWSWQ
jgi:TolB protein